MIVDDTYDDDDDEVATLVMMTSRMIFVKSGHIATIYQGFKRVHQRRPDLVYPRKQPRGKRHSHQVRLALRAFENVDVTDIDDYGNGNNDETFSSGAPCFENVDMTAIDKL